MSTENPPHTPYAQPGLELTQYRLQMIEDTLKAIRDNLGTLAALEQKHLQTREALERAFSTIGKIDERVRKIEHEIPTLTLVRKWVIGGVIGIISMLGLMLFKIFTISVG